ncbi:MULTISPECIES: TolC family protein [unclassified Variovorax]|jgi:outer membrane protein TolC|uniref:TolC family protein n=1 Tax=unclassified Variovorax TaxID=663243 RepID=UPI000F7E6091|nr:MULTISPECIES: TolC family protein [unclassified Variovorax]RSZ44085.1 TolC family protein [Variovorax sp. 553]RSZ45260.1 TolC family protein [Variovorax sp. 679]
MKLWTGIAMIAWALPVSADNRATPADLPPTVSARQWIAQDPAVQEARSALSAAGHTSAMLAASPNEWTTRLSMQRRNYDSGGPASNEWNAQLERPIRINGKADLDRQLGEAEQVIAQAKVGEAVREAARSLLELWIDGLSAAQAQKLFQEQLAFAQANLRAVESRKKAGDASALDVSVAAADFADVERQASLAASNLAKARAKLRVRFPGAQLPAQSMADPLPPGDTESLWLQRVLAAAAPMRVAEGQLRRAELAASRASADRVPDPTVGVFAASEAFRKERIVGVSISIPLSGTYRNERMKQALQEVEVARAAVDRQKRELETTVAETYADATGHLARWQLAERGAAATGESARLTQRAYALGEADLQSLLLARRQFLEASRSALEARADALRANYRLLVDAHLIWDLALE